MCGSHVVLPCGLWCSVIILDEVRCNYISFFKEKTIIVTDLADINRFIVAVDQQRQTSPACRYYLCNHSNDAKVVTGRLPITTVGYDSLLQCLFIVVTEHTSLQKNAVLLQIHFFLKKSTLASFLTTNQLWHVSFQVMLINSVPVRVNSRLFLSKSSLACIRGQSHDWSNCW
jgi:hypothetical protein